MPPEPGFAEDRVTGSRPLRVLVVDDSDVVRRAICKILQAHADIEIICEASNGRDAIRFAKEHQPDLVLMDAAGAHGFVTKDAASRELIPELRRIQDKPAPCPISISGT